ncbi:MAG: MBL fold metallo-hydrolase [Bryobacteraceae bacterium]
MPLPFRMTAGDFQITLVREGVYHWDGGAMFGVVPKTLWGTKFHADEQNRVALAFNCYIVETGAHTVLIETGGGNKMDDRARERMKLPAGSTPLPQVISAAGVDPDRIDIVINTHLHWDHCGWNTTVAGGIVKPTFPRATYFTRRGEWDHAHERHVRDRVSYIDANYDPLVDSGQMQLLDDDREIVPGVSVHLAPGHNSDMMVVTAASNGGVFCFFSDLVPTAAHVTPSWVPAFDLFPLQSIESKTRWLTRAAKGDWLCGWGHDAENAFSRVGLTGEKFHAISQ